MNIHDKSLRDKNITAPEVTTGPLAGSCKVYSTPEGHEALRVPLRQIELSNGAPASSSEAVGHQRVFNVYDSSGPYTDSDADIDVKKRLMLELTR